jgi:DNA-binding LacI/PurR family transcriptional regulator
MQKVLAEADISIPEDYIQPAPIDPESTRRAANKLLDLPDPLRQSLPQQISRQWS